MKSKTGTRTGFSSILIAGIVGVLVLLVGGGIYARQKFTQKEVVVKEPQEAAQATSTIALSPLVNVQQQAAPSMANGTSAQGAKKEITTNTVSKEETSAAVKRFLEYKKEADKVTNWQAHKALVIKFGISSRINDINKGGDAMWQYSYEGNGGAKEFLDKAPKLDAIKIIKTEYKESSTGRQIARILMNEINTTRQGSVVMLREDGVWKITIEEFWPSIK